MSYLSALMKNLPQNKKMNLQDTHVLVKINYRFRYVSDGYTDFSDESDNDPELPTGEKLKTIMLYIWTKDVQDIAGRGFGRREDPTRKWFYSNVAKVFTPISKPEIVTSIPDEIETYIWDSDLGDKIWTKFAPRTSRNKSIQKRKEQIAARK